MHVSFCEIMYKKNDNFFVPFLIISFLEQTKIVYLYFTHDR